MIIHQVYGNYIILVILFLNFQIKNKKKLFLNSKINWQVIINQQVHYILEYKEHII